MSYLVLARKYRPSCFEEVVGQDSITRTLANAITMDRLAHAYLFAGSRGVGKTSIARILAKSLNCENGPSPTPCGECERCTSIAAGSDIDVQEIDAASNRGIDHIRDLRENVRYAPAYGRFKVYIIDEVHQLTNESFNALLKTLEEPPEHAMFVFATTELERVPETVRSRCQIFEFRRLTEEQIAGHLQAIGEKEGIALSAPVAHEVARRAKGGLRDAQSLMDQLITMGEGTPSLDDLNAITGSLDRKTLGDVVDAILARETAKLLSLAGDVCAGGASVGDVFDQLLQYLRELMACCSGVQGIGAEDSDRSRLEKQAAGLDASRLVSMMQIVLTGKSRLKELDDPRLVLELILVKLATFAGSMDLAAALGYLRQLKIPPGGVVASSAPPQRVANRAAPQAPAPPSRPSTQKTQQKTAPQKTTPQSSALSSRPSSDSSPTPEPPPKVAPADTSVKSPKISLDGGVDPDALFDKVVTELGSSSRALATFVSRRFRAVRVTEEAFEVVDHSPDEERFYNLTTSPHRETMTEILRRLFGERCVWKEVKGGAVGPSKASSTPTTTKRTKTEDLAERARDLFEGDIVSE